MSVKPKTVTADELFEMGSDARFELVRGELRRTTPTNFGHGKVAMRLARLLANHVHDNNLGIVLAAETGFVLEEEPDTVRAPDVSFVAKARIPDEPDQAGFARLAPDLAAEVTSPSDTADDVDEKVQDYLRAGVRLIWIIHSKTKTVVEYRSLGQIRKYPEADTLTGHDVVPGFSVPVADLFA